VQIARQQRAKSWELHAAIEHGAALARSGQDRRGAESSRSDLYGWFTEGFDTRDLKEAKVLLDTLAA
jgi:predicted ATPase